MTLIDYVAIANTKTAKSKIRFLSLGWCIRNLRWVSPLSAKLLTYDGCVGIIFLEPVSKLRRRELTAG